MKLSASGWDIGKTKTHPTTGERAALAKNSGYVQHNNIACRRQYGRKTISGIRRVYGGRRQGGQSKTKYT
jgi:hypothetical protein